MRIGVKLGELSHHRQFKLARTTGLALRAGPFVVNIRSPLAEVAAAVGGLYRDFELAADGELADYHVRIAPPRGPRRWLRPQVLFDFDGRLPFKPLPRSQAFPLLEWGLNWCVANHAHQYLILHAAVVARDDRALVMPGEPGTGKSTLCAALVHSGWRLLSDELALLDTRSGLLAPLPRPIGLKNESIDLIAARYPHAVLGPRCADTAKGVVAHLKPAAQCVARSAEPARAAWFVFPRYAVQAALTLEPKTRGRTLVDTVGNAFNYNVLAERGFEVLAGALEPCSCWTLTYDRLDEAIEALGGL